MKKIYTLTIVFLGITLGINAQIPTDGLVAYYPFNGNANDESGNGNDGTVVDAIPAVDRFGNSNSAYEFDGNNGTERYIHSDIGQVDTVTYCVWFNAPMPTTFYNVIMAFGTNKTQQMSITGNHPMYISDNTYGRFSSYSGVDGGGALVAEVFSNNIVSDNSWHFAVISYVPNDSIYLFVDNQLNSTDVYPENNPTDGILYIGRHITEFVDSQMHEAHFNGIIDDIRIYNRALDIEEIDDLFHENGYATVTDIDGNVYGTVQIGNQVWMGENLQTTTYSDGTPIPNVTYGAEWAALTTPAYSWYFDDEATYKDPYGALYNWYSVETGKLCPSDWHVPTNSEWITLTTYLGGVDLAGGKLKETGTIHWEAPNTGATNESGFSAVAGGAHHEEGTYNFLGVYGYYWSSTEFNNDSAHNVGMAFNITGVAYDELPKKLGFSIRCLQDSEISLSVGDIIVDEGEEAELPISVSSLVTEDSIISYQFDIAFDNTTLSYTGYDLAGTIAEGGTVEVNNYVAGELSISFTYSTALIGAGELINLQFNTLKADTTEVLISNAYLNTTFITDLTNGTVIVRDATGITDFGLNNFDIYPNPAKDILFVDGLMEESIARIYNSIGQLLLIENVNSQVNQINISQLPSGIFILKLEVDEEMFVTRFLKE
jgi:uncharacterized protein (TIGR02145 family)